VKQPANPTFEVFAEPAEIPQQIQIADLEGQIIQVVVREEPPPVFGKGVILV
jgi:hypothetical protein